MVASCNGELLIEVERWKSTLVSGEPGVQIGAVEDRELHVFVYFNGELTALEDSALRIGHFDGEVATGWIRTSAVEALRHLPGVLRINLAARPSLSIDRSMVDIRADAVRSKAPPYTSSSGAKAYTGAGVLVGVIDDAIWVRHPFFLHAGGDIRSRKTRIVGLWDVVDERKRQPRPPNFRYGAYWTEQAINDLLSNRGELVLTSEIEHGSHVTGIAVANGAAADNGVPAYTLVGVAPEADIAFSNAANYDSTGATAADALRFLFQLAESRRQPCVVNMSFGTSEGARDGSSDLELAIERALKRPDGTYHPGRAVVVAAGNEAESQRHARKLVLARSRAIFRFEVKDITFPNGMRSRPKDPTDPVNFIDRLYFWYDAPASLSIKITAPNGVENPSGWTSEGEVKVSKSVGVSADATVSANGKKYACLSIWAPITYGVWTIEVVETLGHDTPLDIWIESLKESYTSPRFVDSDAVDANTILCPASALSAIAVGNHICSPGPGESNGALVSHSSRGLDSSYKLGPAGTRPHLTAPGRRIISPNNSSYADERGRVEIMKQRLGNAPNFCGLMTGTSQSAPHVTGVVALMLQKNPHLTAPEIRDILTSTTNTSNIPSRALPNRHWGFGRLDAAAALAKVP